MCFVRYVFKRQRMLWCLLGNHEFPWSTGTGTRDSTADINWVLTIGFGFSWRWLWIVLVREYKEGLGLKANSLRVQGTTYVLESNAIEFSKLRRSLGSKTRWSNKPGRLTAGFLLIYCLLYSKNKKRRQDISSKCEQISTRTHGASSWERVHSGSPIVRYEGNILL
jgi:hypothetical protein